MSLDDLAMLRVELSESRASTDMWREETLRLRKLLHTADRLCNAIVLRDGEKAAQILEEYRKLRSLD